jgi:hypothetical protein
MVMVTQYRLPLKSIQENGRPILEKTPKLRSNANPEEQKIANELDRGEKCQEMITDPQRPLGG